ncbi:MAG: RidA family protein [Meiothermus sp.]|nr:RidA family protein [Meiothermus sp.]
MAIELVRPEKVSPPRGHYSHAVKHGGLVYVSGQLPILPNGDFGNELPFAQQAELVLANLEHILEAADSSLSRVLKVTVYITDIDLWGEFNQIYARHFGDHRPARAVVPVPVLHHGFKLELEAIAAER